MSATRRNTLGPNVIWIVGDQHRAQAMSCAGNPDLRTPNLDRLAGDVPAAAIAGCPLCSPFRGSMLTGRYPHACIPGHDHAMPDGWPTLATHFKAAGYHTAYFGKWHVDGADHRPGNSREAMQLVAPHRRGDFDVWLGYENNNSQWDCWVHGHDEPGQAVPHYHLPGYETDALTDLLVDYLGQRDPTQPFFAVLSVQPPHNPYVAPAEWMARHDPQAVTLRPNVPPVPRVSEAARRDLAGYHAMIENLDWNVGRVMAQLDSAGLSESTYVVFFSDHGDMHGSHGRILKCVPWEESIRIPFVVSRGGRPALKPSSARTAALINHVDIAPTTLGLCGLDVPGAMAGFDYSGCFLDDGPAPTNAPDSAYLQLVDPGWTYGLAADRERPWRGVVTRDGWKYAVLEGQPWLMYDLNEDPFEMANLAMDGRFAGQRRRLQEILSSWMTRTGDSFTLPTI